MFTYKIKVTSVLLLITKIVQFHTCKFHRRKRYIRYSDKIVLSLILLFDDHGNRIYLCTNFKPSVIIVVRSSGMSNQLPVTGLLRYNA